MENTRQYNWQHSVIYQIFIDRFAGMTKSSTLQPIFNGGNIRGIINKFDYLLELGVDCLWVSPFYETVAYHGYHITDFQKVDSHFGTIQDLKDLIDLCHQYQMKIIADFVPNHCSYLHRFFQAAQAGDQEFRRWFYFSKNGKDYKSFICYKEIPKINLSYQPAANHLIESAKYWLALGLDGFRIDHAIGPCREFWNQFVENIKFNYPDSILIGEVLIDGLSSKFYDTISPLNDNIFTTKGLSQNRAQQSYIGTLDGVLDFSLRKYLITHFVDKAHIEVNSQLRATINRHYAEYPSNFLLPAFLDNHDVDRMSFLCNKRERYFSTVELQFSLPQPVIIYYGNESGIEQPSSVCSGRPYADLAVRQNMNWNSIDKETFDLYKQLIIKRKKMFDRI